MINQAICINFLQNHLLSHAVPSELCAYQWSPQVFAVCPNVPTPAIELPDPFHAAQLLIILLQLGGVTSSFDVYSLSITE